MPNLFVLRTKTNTESQLAVVPNGDGKFEKCIIHALATLGAVRKSIDNKVINKSNEEINSKIHQAGFHFSSHGIRKFAYNQLAKNKNIPITWTKERVGHRSLKSSIKNTEEAYFVSSFETDYPCAIVLAGGYGAVTSGVGKCPNIDCTY